MHTHTHTHTHTQHTHTHNLFALFPVSVLPVRSSLLMARLTPAGRPGSLHSCTGVGTIHSWEEGGGRGRKGEEGGGGGERGRGREE